MQSASSTGVSRGRKSAKVLPVSPATRGGRLELQRLTFPAPGGAGRRRPSGWLGRGGAPGGRPPASCLIGADICFGLSAARPFRLPPFRRETFVLSSDMVAVGTQKRRVCPGLAVSQLLAPRRSDRVELTCWRAPGLELVTSPRLAVGGAPFASTEG